MARMAIVGRLNPITNWIADSVLFIGPPSRARCFRPIISEPEEGIISFR